VVNMTAIAAVDAQIRTARESGRKGLAELGGA
jgi:malate dehydrogenase (oxaloacetate-decarboxylating)(NADP+)